MFQRLVVGLRFENRYSVDDDTHRFVSNLIQYAGEHKAIGSDEGSDLYRARIHDPNVLDFPRY